MRLKFAVVALAAGLLSSFTPAAVCPMPEEPEIPDGSTASGAQMQRARKAIEAYLADIARYLECDSTPIKQRRAQLRVDNLQLRFDEQMERYRSKG